VLTRSTSSCSVVSSDDQAACLRNMCDTFSSPERRQVYGRKCKANAALRTSLSHIVLSANSIVVDGDLVTGQNQQSASEYALALLHAMAGQSPVSGAEGANT
jgi:putative intracellular protease/amidase